MFTREKLTVRYVTYSIAIFIIVMLFSILIFSQDAYAYLDPGTGSYIIQIFIAAIVGGLFIIKPFFNKIKGFFKKIFSRGSNNDQAEV